MIKKFLNVVPKVHNIAVAVDNFMWLNLVELTVLSGILALQTPLFYYMYHLQLKYY